MKIFTYLRTLWHEYWMYTIVGPASVDPKVEPYWIPMVKNNWFSIVENLGVSVSPSTEEEARALYLRWCEKTDVPKVQEPLKSNASTKSNQELSKSFTSAHNFDSFIDVENFNLAAKPTYKVWIYNVSRQGFTVDHPVLRKVYIPANTTRKKYCLYTSLPNVVQLPQGNIYTDEITAKPMRGERLAMDLINPDNLGLDQGMKISRPTSMGRNLGEQGVFWSLNNPPKKSEVDAAVKRMEAYYKNLLEKAKALVKAKLSRDFHEMDTPAFHEAAEYFKVTTPWHPVLRG